MKQNFTVRQGALDGVETFLGVARHRSFRRAAAALGVTPSAVSQAVRVLEARLGVALLARTTRSVGLTEAGQRYLDRAAPAFEEHIGPVAALLRDYALDDLHPVEDWALDYPGNWKVATEGAIENYHLPYGHPQHRMRAALHKHP